MKEICKFRFSVNVSVGRYVSKEDTKHALTSFGAKEYGVQKMCFNERLISVDEFMALADEGYAFCHLFRFNVEQKYMYKIKSKEYWDYPYYRVGDCAGALKFSFKRKEYFSGAQCVFVDVDDTQYASISEYVSHLTFPPTCAYSSYSDRVAKHDIVSCRFHMVYVFDQILDETTFVRIGKTLYNQIEVDTNEIMSDTCGLVCNQYLNGCYHGKETYQSDTIYEVSDFVNLIIEEEECPKEAEQQKKESTITFDSDLVQCIKYNPRTVNIKFKNKYQYFYRTERPDWEDNLYQLTDEKYLELYYSSICIKDGQKRRKKLFERACLRRLIKPDVTPDELLYNLFMDVTRFFDNSDNVLTSEVLMTKVENAFALSLEDIQSNYSEFIQYSSENRPRYILHPSIPSAKRAAARRQVSTFLLYKDVLNNLDFAQSATENWKRLNALGIRCSRSYVFQRFKEIRDHYTPELVRRMFSSD